MWRFQTSRLPLSSPIPFHSLGRLVKEGRIHVFVRSPGHDLLLTITPAQEHKGPALATSRDFAIAYRSHPKQEGRSLPGSFVEDLANLFLKKGDGLRRLLAAGETRNPIPAGVSPGHPGSLRLPSGSMATLAVLGDSTDESSFFGWGLDASFSDQAQPDLRDVGELQLAALHSLLDAIEGHQKEENDTLPKTSHVVYLDLLKRTDVSSDLPSQLEGGKSRVTWVIDLPSSCSNRCTFCLSNLCEAHSTAPGETVGHLKQWLLDTAALWPDDVMIDCSLVGRDALNNPDFLEVVALLRTLPTTRRVAVTTPGTTLANPKRAEELANAGVDEVIMTLLGAEASLHDKLAGRPGAYQALIQGVKNLAPLPVTLSFNSVLLRQNIEELPQIIDRVAAFNARMRLYLYTTEPIVTLEQAALNYPRLVQVERALSSLNAKQIAVLDGIHYVPDCVVPEEVRGQLGFSSQKQPSPPTEIPGPCNQCSRWDQGCPSITSHYQKLFGDEELRPVKG